MQTFKPIRFSPWQLLAAFMLGYVLLWLLSFSSTSATFIKPLVPEGAPSTTMPVTLPFSAVSQPFHYENANYYSLRGNLDLPYGSTADTIVIATDNCPRRILINDAEPLGFTPPPKNWDCNFNKTQFLIPIQANNLTRGANSFVIIFKDEGSYYGASLTTKSVWLKKSLIIVAPALFILLFATACGFTRKTLLQPANALAMLLFAIGVYNISLTYDTLSQTYDESSHIAAGMQWWDKNTYTYEYMHMPLARLAGSALLYAADITPHGDYRPYFLTIGDQLLQQNNTYLHNLTLARMGMLPFYLLGGIVIYLWSRRLYGQSAGLLSLLVYVFSPMLTGHAGIAATDFPYAVTCVTALFAFVLWLERPTIILSMFLGITTCLMALTKISCLVQFPIAIALILEWHCYYNAVFAKQPIPNLRPYLKRLLIVALPCFALLLDSVYFFDGFKAVTLALKEAQRKNGSGQAIWLFGPLHNQAVWYYFPVAFFFKNPLPFLALAAIGTGYSFRRYGGLLYQHRAFFPILAALGVIISSVIANINIGSRHVLPAFMLLTIPAGYGLSRLAFSTSRRKQALAAILAAWQLTAFMRIAPDYITYFNEFAAVPEEVLIDTDLDWGQDLLRLRNELKRREIKDITVCYFGEADVQSILGMPVKPCDFDHQHLKGWVAASIYIVKIKDTGIQLLDKPYERIGRSINLYYIE